MKSFLPRSCKPLVTREAVGGWGGSSPLGSPPHYLGLASVQADEVLAFGWSVFPPGYLVSSPVSFSLLVLWQLLPSQNQRVRNLGLPDSQKSCPFPDPALPGALPG